MPSDPRGDDPARQIQPRILRFRDAPGYLGMDRNRFNREVRPYVTEIPIGTQGIAFDRLELDAWVDDYVSRNGRPAQKGVSVWDARDRQASSNEATSGTSTSTSADGAFNKALEQISLKTRSDTSQS